MSDFFSAMKKEQANSDANVSYTENGARGYKTTGTALLDLNFAVSSLRGTGSVEIYRRFAAALGEDFDSAVTWLFFARDVRGGMGERRLFRICFQYLADEFPKTAAKLLPLIAEYGRWDDVIVMLGTKIHKDVIDLLVLQLTQDMQNAAAGKPMSLLAKWMPSCNTSSAKTKSLARRLQKELGINEKQYRKMLVNLRKYANITEAKMSARLWESIEYPAVPSRANLIYNKAFLRHDETRRREYLESVKSGETKINSSVLFPHDIVNQYTRENHIDDTLEALWKALPDTLPGNSGGTIVVADGSGSMTSAVGGGSRVRALDVANALAIYFAERLHGAFKDQYITFSNRPQLVDLRGATSLYGKLRIARIHNEVANTNVEAVFDLILQTALRNQMKQSELPENILIISDMEFDSCASCNKTSDRYYGYGGVDAALFTQISAKYRAHGYRMPRLVFWNVCSRTGTIPVRQNDNGVALVSGFSPNVAKMVMSGKTDPYEALLETLSAPRYDAVRKALV